MIVACGTSYHAGLVGRCAIEQWARVPVEMDIISDCRYRDPVHRPNDLVIGVTQSGERRTPSPQCGSPTAAARSGDHQRDGQSGDRDADAVLFTRSRIEISVAATKTFVSQVAAIYLLGLRLADFEAPSGRTDQ